MRKPANAQIALQAFFNLKNPYVLFQFCSIPIYPLMFLYEIQIYVRPDQ